MSADEIAAVLAELEQLMGSLRGSVGALQAILADSPEVSGDQPATA